MSAPKVSEDSENSEGLVRLLVECRRDGGARASAHLFNASYEFELRTGDAEYVKLEEMEPCVAALFVALTSVYYDYEYLEHKWCADELRRNRFWQRLSQCTEDDLRRAVSMLADGSFDKSVTK